MRKFSLLLLDLLIALYVTGCGSASDATQPTGGPAATPVASSEASPSQAPGKSPSHLQSFAVADQKALPPCDATSEAEIAYVRTEKTLYACEGGNWSQIDLASSETPSVASASETVEATPAAVVLAPNEFIETTSGLVWTKSTVQVLFTDAKDVCSSVGRRLPTEKELVAAVVLGTIKTPGGWVWADTDKQARPDAPGVMIDVEPTDKGYAYCVKD